jgi:hypothetical protein
MHIAKGNREGSEAKVSMCIGVVSVDVDRPTESARAPDEGGKKAEWCVLR